jgi:galactoside O-acetyltransferase
MSDKNLDKMAEAAKHLARIVEIRNKGFKSLGKDTVIYDWAKIVKKEVITIGNNCKIDDFTFIFGGEGIWIGDHVHIGSFTSIIGGGTIKIGDYVGISQGVRLATGTNDHRLKGRLTAAAPLEEQAYYHGHIEIKNDVLILSNAVIMPNITIGEGAIIGALTFVRDDILPWSVNVGAPSKRVGWREKKF